MKLPSIEQSKIQKQTPLIKEKYKIVLDEKTKNATLVKNDGTVISEYSFKRLITDEFTFEEFKKDIDKFNKTLSVMDEFDDIKSLSKAISLHNF